MGSSTTGVVEGQAGVPVVAAPGAATAAVAAPAARTAAIVPVVGGGDDKKETRPHVTIPPAGEGSDAVVVPVAGGNGGAKVGASAAGSATSSDGSATPVAAGTPLPASWDRWVVLAISSMGVLLASVQTSALIIAFPDLVIALNSSLTTMIWILLVVMLAIACVVPLAGRLGDLFGQAVCYSVGFAIFTLSSLLSGFATKEQEGTDLLGYRVVMGVGAAFLFTNSAAIITNSFAPFKQVGLAQGVFNLFASLGSIVGPLIGGGLAVTDWRWIFWFNVPIGGICTILAFIFVRDPPRPRTTTAEFMRKLHKLDWLGAVLLIAFLLLTLLAMTQAVSADPVLSTDISLGFLIGVGVASLIAFCLVEVYVAHDPIVPLKIFLGRPFGLSTLASTGMAFARGSVTYNTIFYLQGPQGRDALEAGIELIPFGVGVMIGSIVAARMTDRTDVRRLSIAGIVLAIGGQLGLAYMGVVNYWWVAFALLVAGLGQGLFTAPNGMVGLTSVPANERGVASAVRMVALMYAQMAGVVITFSFVLRSMSQYDLIILFVYGGSKLSHATVNNILAALRNDYWIVTAFAIASAVASWGVGDYKPHLHLAGAKHNNATVPLPLPATPVVGELLSPLDGAPPAAAKSADINESGAVATVVIAVAPSGTEDVPATVAAAADPAAATAGVPPTVITPAATTPATTTA